MTAHPPIARALRLSVENRLTNRVILDDPDLRRLLDVLAVDGEAARVVGGAVRNALLDRPVVDIDVATTAKPEVVIARAERARLRTIPTGLAHGTVTVLVGASAFEVTTLREDVETDGRHAVVRFARDFAADAQRRDFTINALSVDTGGTIYDTTDGIADLRAARVRFIGAADQRIREDYLRILRFFRFHASYGEGPLDPDGLDAATRHRDALARLSRERIRAELLKLLVAPGAPAVVSVMTDAGVTEQIVGGNTRPDRLGRIAAIEAGRTADPDAILRLAALALDHPGDAARLRAALRLSNDEERRLSEAALARQPLDPARPPDPARARALLFAHGKRAAVDAMALARADAAADVDAAWAEAEDFVLRAARPKLPVGGADVMARGIHSGRTVGAILKRLQAAWIRAGFPDSPHDLARLLDEAVAAERGDAVSFGPASMRPFDSTSIADGLD